jgi:Flp pilus assembly protein TadG
MTQRTGENGSSLIELALILPVALLVACGVFNYAFWIRREMVLQAGAAAGAAYGALPGNAHDSTGMVQAANYSVTGTASGNSAITVTAANFYACSPGGSQVTASTSCSVGAPYHYVQVTTSMTPNATVRSVLLPTSITLTGQATFRVETYP